MGHLCALAARRPHPGRHGRRTARPGGHTRVTDSDRHLTSAGLGTRSPCTQRAHRFHFHQLQTKRSLLVNSEPQAALCSFLVTAWNWFKFTQVLAPRAPTGSFGWRRSICLWRSHSPSGAWVPGSVQGVGKWRVEQGEGDSLARCCEETLQL